MHKRILVMSAGLLLIALLVVFTFATTSAQVQSPQSIEAAPLAQATAAPTKPAPPVAVLKILPVAATAADPNPISATLGATTTVYEGNSGLPNTSVGVPVHLSVSVTDPKNPATKFKWTLTGPADSKAAIKDPASPGTTEFTPDVVGVYRVSVAATNDGGTGPSAAVQIHADTYVGVTKGDCKQCHPDKVAEWSKTGHATKFTREIDGGSDPATSHYSETCLTCHTVGYQIGVKNGGFADVQAQTGWKFPSLASIQSGKGNWDAVPDDLKNVANIQCENCHGPAGDHVKNHAPTMAKSMSEGVCDQCHAVGPHHTKGIELKASKHADASATAWNYPTGADHQECVRCHSGNGYISFLDNPTNMGAWNTDPQDVVCAVCHDPHSDENPIHLRIVGKPTQLPFEAKDAGLSATCEECHNGRTKPEDAVNGSFPHYSSAAEFLNNTGGVTYGQTIADSPHSMMVGAAAIPDPSDKTGKAKLFGGNVPGPCVTCHMWPTLNDAKDPNYLKLGGHSFNTVSPDGKTNYTAACQMCHGKLTTFDFPAKADYDGNGKVEGVQTEVKGLLNVLWTDLEAKGLKKVDTGYPYATLPKGADGKVDPKISNAWYNFRVVYGVMWGAEGPGNQGAAQAVHNFNRSVSLLQLSIKDLTGSLPSGMTELK